MSITKDMTIREVVTLNPKTVPVFMRHGMGCIGCSIANYESVEEGATAHGIDVEDLVKDLNEVLE